jgi:GntR family transcriptional regulator/GntR family frlABCD operon transcriptional regulator
VDGVYKEGDLLPSENELCSVYNITRPTVRHALYALVNDGYIKKQQGKGSIVHALPKGIGILSIAGTTSALGVKNLETRIRNRQLSHGRKISFLSYLIRRSSQAASNWFV